MFEWFISLRYLRAKHRHGFISLISLISVAGITVGVIALIVVLAVYSGFTDGLRDQILGVNSHIIVQRLGGSSTTTNWSGSAFSTVEGVDRRHALHLCPDPDEQQPAAVNGVVLRGIDPATAKSVISLSRQMIKRVRLTDLDQRSRSTRVPNIILGKNLAKRPAGRCRRPGPADLARRAAHPHGRHSQGQDLPGVGNF